MIDLNPQIIEKDGNKAFVILAYEDFVKIQNELEDYEDLRVLREAKLKDAETPTIGFKDAKKELNLE